MTYILAIKILDKAKDGTPYPLAIINRALMMTGDLDELQEAQHSGGQSPARESIG
jgi:hypothetical protein